MVYVNFHIERTLRDMIKSKATRKGYRFHEYMVHLVKKDLGLLLEEEKSEGIEDKKVE